MPILRCHSPERSRTGNLRPPLLSLLFSWIQQLWVCSGPRLLGASATLFAAAALLVGCHHGPPPTPLDQLNPQQAHGHTVFQTYCGQCHDDRDTSALHAPSLLGVFKKPYLPSGAPATDERVTQVIQNGYSLMPPVRNMDPQDTNDLLAYLHTL